MGNIMVGGILGVMGALLFLWGLKNLRLARSARSWISTDGEILDVRAVERRVHSDHRSGIRAKWWVLEGAYRYTTPSGTHEGTRIAFDQGNGRSEEQVRKQADELKSLQHVRVYYNPSNPDESVLFQEVGRGIYRPVIMGALFALAGIGVILEKYPGYKYFFG